MLTFVVMFISQQLSDTNSAALEESRWLGVGSAHPVTVYIDHSALLTILKGEGTATHPEYVGVYN